MKYFYPEKISFFLIFWGVVKHFKERILNGKMGGLVSSKQSKLFTIPNDETCQPNFTQKGYPPSVGDRPNNERMGQITRNVMFLVSLLFQALT